MTVCAQVVQLPSHEPLFVLQGGDTPNVNILLATPSGALAPDTVSVEWCDLR